MADKDRPDVLAHKQFEAERRVFVGLNLAQRFQRIYDTNLWGADTSISGLGSEESVAAAFRDRLTILLKKLKIVTLLDAPCGDANWITRADMHGIRYIGVDIVPDLIARLQAKKRGPLNTSSPILQPTRYRAPMRFCAAIASYISVLPTSLAP